MAKSKNLMVHETGLDEPKVDEIAVDEPGPHQHNDLGH